MTRKRGCAGPSWMLLLTVTALLSFLTNAYFYITGCKLPTPSAIELALARRRHHAEKSKKRKEKKQLTMAVEESKEEENSASVVDEQVADKTDSDGASTKKKKTEKYKFDEKCLDPSPDGPIPVVLISLGRSGGAAIWQIMGNLTGEETISDEFTGSDTKSSLKFFEEQKGHEWVSKRLCNDQKRHPTAAFVGFKMKPNRAIFKKSCKQGLQYMAKKGIKVVRSARNELDVLISRQKHLNMEKLLGISNGKAHCDQGDTECEELHRKYALGIELDTKNLLRNLKHLREHQNTVDNLLNEFNVPVVKISYDRLFRSENAEEWMKIFRFLGVGPQEGLTMEDVKKGMMYAATSSSNHSSTLRDYDKVADLLRGTEFEELLH